MPITIKGLGRRKSSGNALDIAGGDASADSPAQSTFRVLERPENKPSYAPDPETKRTFASPLQALRGKSVDNLTLMSNGTAEKKSTSRWGLNPGRGSAGTANSGSSGYNDSAVQSGRHSSSSTLPSSLERDRDSDDEDLFAARKPPVSAPPVAPAAPMGPRPSMATDDLPPPPSFSSRAARAFSFGSKSKTIAKELAREEAAKKNSSEVPPIPSIPSLPPPHADTFPQSPPRAHSPQRQRALTTSSYASTAVPNQPQSELTLDASIGNDDFGSMFDNLKRNSVIPPGAANAGPQRKDTQPLYPPKTLSRRSFTVSQAQNKRDEPETLYARAAAAGYGGQSDSAVSSPGLSESKSEDDLGETFFKGGKPGYSLVPDRHNSPSPGPEASLSRNLASDRDGNAFPSRQTQLDDGDRWVKRVELQDNPNPVYNSPQSTRSTGVAKQTPSRGPTTRGLTSPASGSRNGESDITPRAQIAAAAAELVDEPLFDSSPAGPASRAIRPGVHSRADSGGARRMTNQQFKLLQKRAEDITNTRGSQDGSDNEELDDDEDDTERARKMATQRRKQEANMSVYRQQMKKVTGGGPRDLAPMGSARPDANRGSSMPNLGNLHFGGASGIPPPNLNTGRNKPSDSDEDEDVPLGILQAHGFPNGARPPTRLGSGQNDVEYQRRTSVAGSVVNGGGGGGGYPAFARRLPADPYFGAGIVNQSNRESLALHHSSSASVYGGMGGGMPPTPGGLVGVIAGEERARAARRANPGSQGFGYHAGGSNTNLPLPTNMLPPQQQQQTPRAMSMTGTMNPMSMMPGMIPPNMAAQMDPSNPQVQQFMQMQMQFMQSMMALQQQQVALSGGNPAALQQPMAANMLPQPQYPQSLLAVPGQPRPNSEFFGSAGTSRPASMLDTGRAMTMNGPPSGWNAAAAVASRPGSAYLMSGGVGGGGPGPGYTPSIAPSERSNIGLPGRYRPVSSMNLANPNAAAGANPSSRASVMGVPASGRSQSFTASSLLNFPTQQQQQQQHQAQFQQQQQQFQQHQQQQPASESKPTIRALDKPKSAGLRASFMPSSSRPSASPAASKKGSNNDEDDDGDDGWAEMQRKRAEKKRSRWTGLLGGGGKKENDPVAAGSLKSGGVGEREREDDSGLGEVGELYKGLNV